MLWSRAGVQTYLVKSTDASLGYCPSEHASCFGRAVAW